MRRRRAARGPLVLLAACAALITAGCSGGQAAGPPGGAGAAFAFKPQVSVITLQSRPVTLTRELPGRTSAYLVADVRPQVSGIVKRRLFTEGGLVHAGQVLYQIDDALYRAQYENAKAALERARATEVAARLAARRSAELVKLDAVSAQDNENAIAAARQADADVAAAQAAVNSAGVNLAYARITAPISGRIGRSTVTQGALVTADQATALATIQVLDPIYVDVNQSSADYLALRQEIDAGRVQSRGAGTAATIVLEDGTHYAQKGRLQFTDVSVDPTTGNFLMRVLVPNPKQLLIPGMFVHAVVDEGVLPDGILVPQGAVQHDPRGEPLAFVVNAQGKVEQRSLGIARAVGNQWLVDHGLSSGDRLIVSGLQKIQPGMAVQAVEAASTAGYGGGGSAAAPVAPR